jgi:hypothetical protein
MITAKGIRTGPRQLAFAQGHMGGVALRDDAACLVARTVSTCVVSEPSVRSASVHQALMVSTKRLVDGASNSCVQESKKSDGRKCCRTSPNRIELAFRTPRDGIYDPSVNVRFMPAGPVGADFKLSRERTLGDLTVDGRPGQPGPGKNGFQADDTVWFSHGRAGSRSLFLTPSETRKDRLLQARKSNLHIGVLWRSDGGN